MKTEDIRILIDTFKAMYPGASGNGQRAAAYLALPQLDPDVKSRSARLGLAINALFPETDRAAQNKAVWTCMEILCPHLYDDEKADAT